MGERNWLRATGEDGRQHVLYYPERAQHTLHHSCACKPSTYQKVVIHTTLTAAGRKARGNA